MTDMRFMYRIIRVVLALAVLAPALLNHEGLTTAAQPPDKFTIKFKSRHFRPAPGLERAAIQQAAGPAERVHFLLQVHEIPAAAGRQQLEAEGIRLLNYVTGNTFIASMPAADLDKLANIPNVRWAGPLAADDKLSAALKAGNIGAWARAARGQAVLTIQFHPDVASADAEALVARLGGQQVGSVPSLPSVTAIFHPGQSRRIAREDSVQFLAVVDAALDPHNDGVRPAANATPLAAAPYNLTGAGTTVLVYDSGIVETGHPDFGTRVIQTDPDPAETVRDHSTHVAGTVAGSGANSNGNDSAGNPNGGSPNQWAGLAPAANVRSFGSSGSSDVLYDDGGDLNNNFTTAINNGIDIATMSLGNNVVSNGFPCAQLGDYVNTPILIDNIVRGSINGQQLIFTESAGNERQLGAPCGQFSTISSPATAKNSIAVGAINSNDNSMTGFSSFGPTDDGRLKPDIVGPGCQSSGDLGITSPSFIDGGNGNLDPGEVRNAYVVKCGTSMSAPVVAGSLALLAQQWQALNGAGTRPLAHTAKAILVHSAVDLGNAGPDYQFGWGALDAQAAVDLVRANDSANLIHTDQADQGNTVIYTFNSDGSTSPQVTLAWSDPAATRLAATTLINDLNLRLIAPDATVFQPFTLNPAAPGNVATTGNDSVNNVEVVTGNTQAGTWQVQVTGATVPLGPQAYTLITPADAAINQPPSANAGGPYATSEGTTVPLNGGASSDPDGDPLTFEWDFNDNGVFDDATGPSPNFTNVAQDGVLPVHLRVTDPDGAFSVDTTTVTVSNVTPQLTSLATSPAIDENDTATLTGAFSDPGVLDPHTVIVNWGDGSPLENVLLPLGSREFELTHQYLDDNPTGTPVDSYPIVVKVADDDSISPPADTEIVVHNLNPTATIDAPLTGALYEVNTIVNLAISFDDIGTQDTHTCSIDWDDGSSSAGTVAESGGSGTCSASRTFTAAGVYSILATISDDDTGAISKTVMVVVYDPSAGFVTGGGWINSPAGAYTLNPAATGRANFGFVSKYKKGAHTPTGETEFQFKTADLNFHSTSYQWLVVAGAKAQYKGTGTVNGLSGFGFLLTATDGQRPGGGGEDKFRIKIKDLATDTVIYDNVAGASEDIDDANPQEIEQGSIVIHSK